MAPQFSPDDGAGACGAGSIMIDQLISDELLCAARAHVITEVDFAMTPEDVRLSSVKSKEGAKRLNIDWWWMARAFVHGAVWQMIFGEREIGTKAALAALSHINENVWTGDSIIGSVQTVIEAISVDKARAAGPFAGRARAFMAGAKWTIQKST